jgi:hypothetical protein
VVGGEVRSIEVYAADPVGVADDLGVRCRAAPALARFDPGTAVVGTALPVHALRRAFGHVPGLACPRVGLTLWASWIDPVLDFVVASAHGDRLTHLHLDGAWDYSGGPYAMLQANVRELALGPDDYARLLEKITRFFVHQGARVTIEGAGDAPGAGV